MFYSPPVGSHGESFKNDSTSRQPITAPQWGNNDTSSLRTGVVSISTPIPRWPSPAWPENVWGYSFSPFRAGQDPTRNVYPSEQEIAADIEMLAEQTNRLRTYSVRDSLGEIP